MDSFEFFLYQKMEKDDPMMGFLAREEPSVLYDWLDDIETEEIVKLGEEYGKYLLKKEA
jgi:hypothetical protein